jgi:trk system potassium uptake protein TrkH
MDIQKDTEDVIAGRKSFWFSERIIFLGTLVSFVLFAVMLLVTEAGNIRVPHHTFLDFLFDTVSVGTLTGLFRGDSGTFSFGGQFVLLLDMIINGLIASFISILLIIFVRLGFDRKQTLRTEIENIGMHSKDILLFVFFDFLFIWLLGTVMFQLFGGRTLWESIFNSASHILNNGVTAFPNNMIIYNKNFSMLLSGAFLITIGGWGISVRGYFYKMVLGWFSMKKLAKSIPDAVLAPKNFIIAIILTTAVLQLFGAFTMFGFEINNAKVLPGITEPAVKFLNTYYMSVSARTAGFTTMPDLSLLHDKSNYILMFLMTIGASSGSFAGGVFKLTAFIYLFVYLISRLRGDHEVRTKNAFLHFSERTVIEANFRIIGFTIIILVLLLLLFFVQPDLSGLYLTFEAISGVSNTGLSLGATGLLNSWGMILIIILMTVGKLGFITTVISFFPKYQHLLEHAKHDHDEFPVD